MRIILLFFVAVTLLRAGDQIFPPTELRGYGTLSGTLKSDADSSVLTIQCESEAKAKLVLAKYLSDLDELTPVTPLAVRGPNGPLHGWTAPEQGALLAVRDGRVVRLFAAATPEKLGQLAQATLPPGGADVSDPEMKVPMALDRFDKYGLQSYYHPYTPPQNRTPTSTVVPDVRKDINFTLEENHMGLVLAQGPTTQETADDISTKAELDWVHREAAKDQLPLGINLDVYRVFALMNRYPEEVIQYQPQFLGGWYGSLNFAEEIPAWNGFRLKDEALGEVQHSIREMAKEPTITDWLEPHSEMAHGVADYLLEFGPVADTGYRIYLKSQYSLAALSQRWKGDPGALKSWDDVRVPEFYSFIGWGPDAIDLTGKWRIGKDAPYDDSSAAPALDDSSWPEITAPGHAIVRFLPRHPAVFRRHIAIDPAWRKAHDRVWLYLFDLNDNRGEANGGWKIPAGTFVKAYVNGKLIPEMPVKVTESHWVALEVSGELAAGDNQVTIELPSGLFNGRVYFSPQEPRTYPNLGPQLNAQWADYADWNRWARAQAVERGSQMIRQVDPVSGIKLAAPGDYVDGITQTAIRHGGDLHDTGSMAGFWNEIFPAIMRGARLPFSAEPGGAAPTANDFESFFGRWITEGVNQIDYFQELGDIEWYPDIKKCLDDNRAVFTSVGKYHAPVARVAALYSSRNSYLVDFPWNDNYHPGSNPDNLGSGYWHWNVRSLIAGDSDGLTESSFANGDAARYPVVFDTNTTVMDEKLLVGIEKYVHDGGTFVTFVQTGRHTSAEKDEWPIEKLTGYHVTSLMQREPWQKGALAWAPDQKIFSGTYLDDAKADGLSLKKIAPEAQDLATWKADGSVAIGMRKLGKGTIIEVGCRFTEGGLPQRFDEGLWDYYKGQDSLAMWGLPATKDHGLMTPELVATGQIFNSIVAWRNGTEKRTWFAAEGGPAIDHVRLRHDISNNGLYDVWSLWNDSDTDTIKGALHLEGKPPASWCIDLRNGQRIAASPGDEHFDITLAPCQLSIYLSPRGVIAAAPAEWFQLQRNWWQGTGDAGKPFPPPSPKLAEDLSEGWSFKPLGAEAYVPSSADGAGGAPMDLGIFSISDYPGATHGIFYKKFFVPDGWNAGAVQFSLQCWNGDAFHDRGRVFLDGKLLDGGLVDNAANGAFKAGSTHVMEIEVTGGKTALTGVVGPAWLAYHPKPAARQDLSGAWEVSTDDLRYTPGTLPGPFAGTAARHIVHLDPAASSRTVVFHALGTGLRGVIINGRYVGPMHHFLSNEENLNITPWVKAGQDNEFILLGAGGGEVKEVSLEFHDKGRYP